MIVRDNNHFYYDHETMERYISVTQHLTIAGLVDLSMVRPDDLEYARKRGEYIHASVNLYHYDDLDIESLSESYKGYVKGYIKFCQDHMFTPFESEEMVWSDQLRTAGTFDLTGITSMDKKLFIDIKATASMSPTVGVQLAGYNYMKEGNDWYDLIGLQLFSNGRYKMHKYDYNSCVSIFKGIVRSNWWALSNGIIPVGAKASEETFTLCKEIVG